ncbi:RdgB/HAM1 family non-canonical purine NTP pyrophosphatase [Methylovirgula sp. HY1]|uniref:RdgB/HAM1 family non-canonical purine NTP pyrophosphatase n=1 Tax=Methylovirgula sp. HY1 TaxID=2822761 RepID=UPI001C5BF10D|nr:RdgB/HAM1 family non-canonical purine NTP pyrophosphatase [Methylovirgula sp. HY1]QXX75245.1 Non-canonical purine NTP pyrophosphatase [Methylovirgula sp. HY1]
MRKLEGRLVIATHNAGKLWEMRDLLAPHGLDAVSAGDLGLAEPEETGETFHANAELKALAAAQAAGLPALADDSGLCVEGLGGAPGIYSARWAEVAPGGPRDFAAAMEKLETALTEIGATPPFAAHFVSVMTLAWPDGTVESFEGKVFGTLVFPPRGMLGFGYDPIFLPEGLTRTFGEMMAAEKQAIPADGSPALSHRARAFQAFARAYL